MSVSENSVGDTEATQLRPLPVRILATLVCLLVLTAIAVVGHSSSLVMMFLVPSAVVAVVTLIAQVLPWPHVGDRLSDWSLLSSIVGTMAYYDGGRAQVPRAVVIATVIYMAGLAMSVAVRRQLRSK